jgi:Spy/CpxP family protein refolding chaperone
MEESMIRMRWRLGLGFAPVALALVLGCEESNTPPASPTAAAPSASAPAAPEPASSTAAAPAASAVPDVAQAGPSTGTEEEDESMADVKEHHRHHHHGGFAMFIAMSLDLLGTTPEQDASIKKIQTDMRAKMAPARDAEKNLLGVIGSGVSAGKIDKAKVDAAIAKVTAASASVHDAVADSLNQLHATLTPPQRTALMDKVEAHYQVWHEANSDDEPAEKDAHGGHLGHLAKELNLTPDQVEKIRASFKTSMGTAAHPDPAEAEAHLKAFGAAFEADTFDAKTITTGGPASAHMATWGATRMARFYQAVAPVLTPEQRTKLADSLKKHANYQVGDAKPADAKPADAKSSEAKK